MPPTVDIGGVEGNNPFIVSLLFIITYPILGVQDMFIMKIENNKINI